MDIEVKLTSHKKEFEKEFEEQIEVALEAIGLQASGYAQMKAPADTGRLRNSITYATAKNQGRSYSYKDDGGKQYDDKVGSGAEKDSVYIGTNVEYAVYQELGTSKTKAHPFLKPAATEHSEEYKRIVEKYMKG